MIAPANENKEDLFRIFKKEAEAFGVYLSTPQIQAFSSFLHELRIWNKKINLFKRNDDIEIIIKDFLDSLTILKYLPPGAALLDMGSGAGFPGIPAKIARQDLRVVLVEIRSKKVFFLKHMIRLMGMEGLNFSLPGGEDLKCDFDFVVSRAFGSFERVAESGLPYLNKNGMILLMKGKRGKEELNQEFPILEKKGWKVSFVDKIKLPVINHQRILIALERNYVSRGTIL